MLRLPRYLLSTALHTTTPFVDAALQLCKLQLAHKNAVVDRNTGAARAIEGEFLREIEAFRPAFTMYASLQVAQQYAKRLHSALRYFGMADDPLMGQLDLLMGRVGMQQASHRSQGMFKGVRPSGAPPTAMCLEEREETTLPGELPNPPQVDHAAPRRPGAIRVPLRYRGHWVLQEPEIAITRAERREDPW